MANNTNFFFNSRCPPSEGLYRLNYKALRDGELSKNGATPVKTAVALVVKPMGMAGTCKCHVHFLRHQYSLGDVTFLELLIGELQMCL